MRQFFASIMIVLTLAACANNGSGQGPTINKENIGTIAGAAIGAIAGSNVGGGKGNIAAIAVGTLAGAWVGSEVGKSLDRADIAYMNQTTQRSLETSRTGAASSWTNPDSGASGTVTPTRTVEKSGTVCREYTQTVTIGGKTEEAVGTACRQADGSWKIVN